MGLVGWDWGEEGFLQRLWLSSQSLQCEKEGTGDYDRCFDLESSTLGQVLVNTSVRPLVLVHYYRCCLTEGEAGHDTGVLDTHVCQLG